MKSGALLILASIVSRPLCFAQNADFIAAAAKSLRSPQYENVRVSIRGNSVTLTGSVALYATREEAEYRVGHLRGIGMVRNEIQIETPAIPDGKLQKNLEIAMAANLHRRLHSLPNISDLISVHVHSGVVILEGDLPSLQLARDVFDAVAQTKGVHEIIDHIQLGSNPELDTLRTPGLGTDAGAAAGNVQGPSVGTGIH